MCFPYEGKIITIDQLAYYKLSYLTSPKSIISSMSGKQYATPLSSVSLGVYKDSTMLGAFPVLLLLSLSWAHRVFACYRHCASIMGFSKVVWYL